MKNEQETSLTRSIGAKLPSTIIKKSTIPLLQIQNSAENKDVAKKNIQKAIALLVQETQDQLNFKEKMSVRQIAKFSKDFLYKHPLETLSDLSSCLRMGRTGEFGPVYRIDGLILFEWFGKFLQYKLDKREAKVESEKRQAEVKSSKYVSIEKIRKLRKELEAKSREDKTRNIEKPNTFESWKQIILEAIPEASEQWLKDMINYLSENNINTWGEENFTDILDALKAELKKR